MHDFPSGSGRLGLPRVQPDRPGGRRVSAPRSWLTKTTVRPSALRFGHAPEALPLELGVADGEDLVDDQDLGLEVRGDREREPHVHAAGVALDRRVEELLDAGEVDDCVESCGDLGGVMPRMAPLR